MKSYRWKIIVCLVPVLISLIAVGRAYYLFEQGRGGFRLGVDLVGGTILVYEVDQDKQQQYAGSSFAVTQRTRVGLDVVSQTRTVDDTKIDELAAAIKRRLDPSDQYNITVRPVGRERIEIILPTGGQVQAEAARKAWQETLQEAEENWPPQGGKTYDDLPTGSLPALATRIREMYPEVEKEEKEHKPNDPPTALGEFVAKHRADRRFVTSEEVQEFKELIAQVGNLEFRILANPTDDGEAIDAATKEIDAARGEEEKDKPGAKKPSKLDDWAMEGKPPDPPNGGKPFANGYGYHWVEIGWVELKSMKLNSAHEADGPNSIWARAAEARKEGRAMPFPMGESDSVLIYSRDIPSARRSQLQKTDEQKKFEYFVLTRDPEIDQKTGQPKEITGAYLTDASVGTDALRPEVHFRFNSRGADLFQELTSKNKPSNNVKRYLAIVLDGKVNSAPYIKETIRDQGVITVGNVKEAYRLTRILKAGALPATLKSPAVSEQTMGATLGADTIKWGTISVGVAFAAVLLFMLVYYRFAGFVACVALLANLLLTVAFMVMFGAAFTLPGLAGLVLMLGMAVDANVLIYERLREERDRGASLALAIRNGYDRALPTIIDTHMTGIFTAIVLFIVGNDQLKGFGVSLTAGLIISLFTSLFMTHTMFEIWQDRGWLKKLSMLRLLSKPNIDFMAIRYYWFAATVILTIFGVTVFLVRGRGGLNIDFIGGTAYSGQLADGHALDITGLRRLLSEQRQRDLLAVPEGGVTPVGSDGRTFEITYAKEVGGSKTETVTLPNSATPEDVRRRAQELPDLAVKQIFHSDFRQADPSTSLFFKIESSEKAPELVFASVNRLFTDDDGNSLLARKILENAKVDATTRVVTLHFTDPDGKNEAPASPAQVTMLLQRQLRAQDLIYLADHIRMDRVAGHQKDVGGQLAWMQFSFKEDVDPKRIEKALAKLQDDFKNRPQPLALENFDSVLAAETQGRAAAAIVASWAAILLYLWFRFGSWTFGAAAVLCLIHDLCFTLGMIAFCHYVHQWAPGLATALALHDFKLDLTAVAALLTLVGYSVSDTIVVFDRIREVRGKDPRLTPQMINDSVNQTLSRTLLTAFSVWLVVFVLYVLGGEGIHLFAFVMVIGVIVGTYSSIYIASPLLLIFGEGSQASRVRHPQPAAARE
jgi:SecD/SecF fusion protein